MLSECGAEDLADFARARRIDAAGDLDLCVSLLPFQEAIEFGCACLEHVMTGRSTVRRHSWLIAKVARVRRLLRKQAPAQQLAAEGQSLADYRTPAISGRDEPHLQCAVQSLAVALEHADAGYAAGIAVAALARSLRSHWRFRSVWKDELGWQINQAQHLLSELAVRAERTSR